MDVPTTELKELKKSTFKGLEVEIVDGVQCLDDDKRNLGFRESTPQNTLLGAPTSYLIPSRRCLQDLTKMKIASYYSSPKSQPHQASSSGIPSTISCETLGNTPLKTLHIGALTGFETIKSAKMKTNGPNYSSVGSNSAPDIEKNEYYTLGPDLLGNQDTSFTSIYTEYEDYLLDPEDSAQLYECKPYYIPTNIKVSATLCELISRLSNDELETRAPKLPLLFSINNPQTQHVWSKVYQEAREILRQTQLSSQLPPFHLMFPCLFPEPLSRPEIIELWIHAIILLHYSITRETWFNVLTVDQDEDFSECNLPTGQSCTDAMQTTGVGKFLEWMRSEAGAAHTWITQEEHSMSALQLKQKCSAVCSGIPPAISTGQLLRFQDSHLSMPQQQLLGKMKCKHKAHSAEDRPSVDHQSRQEPEFLSPYMCNAVIDNSSGTVFDTESGVLAQSLHDDKSACLTSQSYLVKEIARLSSVDKDDKSTELYFRVFFSGIFGLKYLKPINRGDFHLLEEKYFKSIVVDGSILFLVLRSRAALTLGFSFLMTYKLQRLALLFNWDKELLLPNAEILISSTSPEVDLDLPDLTVIRQTRPILVSKSALDENSILSDTMSEIVELGPVDHSTWPVDASLALKIFNSKLIRTIQDVLEGGMYDIISKIVDLDLCANRPISLIQSFSKQGKNKTDITVLRSVCHTVSIPKLICSADLFVLEKNILPIVQNKDTDPTIALNLIRLIETLRAPLSFETSSNPKSISYHHIMEKLTIQSIPGRYIICQYLCKGQWRVSIAAPGRDLTVVPRSYGLYDYIYVRPDFTSIINNPFLPLLMKDYSKDQEWHRIMIIPKIRSAMLHCSATPAALSGVIRALSNLQHHKSILKYVVIENLFDPILKLSEGTGSSNVESYAQKASPKADKPTGLRLINVQKKQKEPNKGMKTPEEKSEKQPNTSPVGPSQTPVGIVSPQQVLSPRLLVADVPDSMKKQNKMPENDNLATPYYTTRKRNFHAQQTTTTDENTLMTVISRTIPSWKVNTTLSNLPSIATQESEVIMMMTTLKKNKINPIICFDLMLPLSTSTTTDIPARYSECMRKCDRIVKAGLTSLRVLLPQSTISYYSCLKKTLSNIPSISSTGVLSSGQQNVGASSKLLLTNLYDCTAPNQSTNSHAGGASTAGKITRLLLDYSNNNTWALLLNELAMTHYKYGFTGVVLRGIDYPYFLCHQLLPSIKQSLLRKLTIDIWSRMPSLVIFAFAVDTTHACILMKAGIIPILRTYDKSDLNELNQFSIQAISESVNVTPELGRHVFPTATTEYLNRKQHSGVDFVGRPTSKSPTYGRITPFLKELFSFSSICSMFVHKPLSLFTIDDINMKSGLNVRRTIESMRHANNKIAFSKMLHNTTTAPDSIYFKDSAQQQKPSLYTQMEYPAILDLLSQITTAEFVRHVCVNDVTQMCNSGLCYGIYRDSSQSLAIVISNVGNMRQFLITIQDICHILECDVTSFMQVTYKFPGTVRMSVAYNAVYDEPISNFNESGIGSRACARGEHDISSSAKHSQGRSAPPEEDQSEGELLHSYKPYTASHIDLADVTMADLRNSSYLNIDYDYSMGKFQDIKLLSNQWNGCILTAGIIAYGGLVVTAPCCSIFALKVQIVPDNLLLFTRPTKSLSLYRDTETFSRDLLNVFMNSTVFIDKQVILPANKTFRSQHTSKLYSIQCLETYVWNFCCRLTDMILCMHDTDTLQRIQSIISVVAHSQFSVLLLAAANQLVYSQSSENSASLLPYSKQIARSSLRSSLFMKSPLGKEIVEAKQPSSAMQLVVTKTINTIDLMRMVPRYVLEIIASALEVPPHVAWTIPINMLVESARSILSFLYPNARQSIRCANNRDSSGLLQKSTYVPDIIIVASRLGNFIAAKALLLAESGYSVALYAPLFETPQGQESVPTQILGPISYTGETYRNEYLWHNFGIHHLRRRLSAGTTLEITLLHSFEFFYDTYHDANIALNEREKCISEMLIDEETNDVYSYYKRGEQIVYDGSCQTIKSMPDACDAAKIPGIIPFLEGEEGQNFAEQSLVRAKIISDFMKQKYRLSENHTGVAPRMIVSTPGLGATAALSLAVAFGSQQVRSLKLTEGPNEHSGYDIDESCGLTSEYTFVSRPKMVLLMTPNIRSLLEFMYDLLGVKFMDYSKVFDLIKHLGIPDTGILDSFHPYFLYTVRAAVLDYDVICGDFDVINLLKKTPWISWALSNKEIIVDDESTELLVKYMQLLTDLIERA